MLEEYFSAPKTLRRLRTGPSGSYIDGFADASKGRVTQRLVRFVSCAMLRIWANLQSAGHHRRKHAESFLSSPR
jgi:hypothetical protein